MFFILFLSGGEGGGAGGGGRFNDCIEIEDDRGIASHFVAKVGEVERDLPVLSTDAGTTSATAAASTTASSPPATSATRPSSLN